MNVGLATGLIGGGMLVPLGPVFSAEVLDAGAAGFGILIFALGTGVAVGVVMLSVFQRHIPKPQVFAWSVFGAGISLIIAASMSSLGLASLFVGVLGVGAGSVYVLGFTLLHENVDDELRGRIFSALYTLVRFCVLLAFAVGPFLSGLLGAERLPGGEITVAGAVDRDARRAPHAVARRADHRRRRRPGHRVAALGRRGRARRRARPARSTSSCSRRAPSWCRA